MFSFLRCKWPFSLMQPRKSHSCMRETVWWESEKYGSFSSMEKNNNNKFATLVINILKKENWTERDKYRFIWVRDLRSWTGGLKSASLQHANDSGYKSFFPAGVFHFSSELLNHRWLLFWPQQRSWKRGNRFTTALWGITAGEQDLGKALVKACSRLHCKGRTVGLVLGVFGSSRPPHSSSFILGLSLLPWQIRAHIRLMGPFDWSLFVVLMSRRVMDGARASMQPCARAWNSTCKTRITSPPLPSLCLSHAQVRRPPPSLLCSCDRRTNLWPPVTRRRDDNPRDAR